MCTHHHHSLIGRFRAGGLDSAFLGRCQIWLGCLGCIYEIAVIDSLFGSFFCGLNSHYDTPVPFSMNVGFNINLFLWGCKLNNKGLFIYRVRQKFDIDTT